MQARTDFGVSAKNVGGRLPLGWGRNALHESDNTNTTPILKDKRKLRENYCTALNRM